MLVTEGYEPLDPDLCYDPLELIFRSDLVELELGEFSAKEFRFKLESQLELPLLADGGPIAVAARNLLCRLNTYPEDTRVEIYPDEYGIPQIRYHENRYV